MYLTHRFRKIKSLPQNRDSSPVPSVIDMTPRTLPPTARSPSPPLPVFTGRSTGTKKGVHDRLELPRSPSLDESLGQVVF